MANAPIPNISAPIAAVLIDPATGSQYRFGGSDVATPVTTNVPNIAAPVAAVLFDPNSQTLYAIH